MKFILSFLFSIITIFAIGQDSLKVGLDVTLASKNVWRGINYGDNAPSLQADIYVKKGIFRVGVYGTATTNGTKNGYGNWIENYIAIEKGNFTFTVDDYYFFSQGNETEYFNYKNDSTQHLIELRLKYAIADRFNITGGYNVYAAKGADKAFYFETEFYPIRGLFSVSLGYVTGPSWLNYYTKAGVTTVGVNAYKTVKITNDFKIPFKGSVIVNPNYKNIANEPGLGRSPINFVISLTL